MIMFATAQPITDFAHKVHEAYAPKHVHVQPLPEATLFRASNTESFDQAEYAAEEFQLIATRGPIHYVLTPLTDETRKVGDALQALLLAGLVRVNDNGSYQLA